MDEPEQDGAMEIQRDVGGAAEGDGVLPNVENDMVPGSLPVEPSPVLDNLVRPEPLRVDGNMDGEGSEGAQQVDGTRSGGSENNGDMDVHTEVDGGALLSAAVVAPHEIEGDLTMAAVDMVASVTSVGPVAAVSSVVASVGPLATVSSVDAGAAADAGLSVKPNEG